MQTEPLSRLERLPRDILTTIICDHVCAPVFNGFGEIEDWNYFGGDEIECDGGHLPVSHISRTFRYLTLSLPRLWSRLKSNMGGDELAVHLARSKDAGLAIILYEILSPEREDEKFWSFITAVAAQPQVVEIGTSFGIGVLGGESRFWSRETPLRETGKYGCSAAVLTVYEVLLRSTRYRGRIRTKHSTRLNSFLHNMEVTLFETTRDH